ncbi:hypothetical protein RB9863 [Rhodopirellula baltica SH 1]|uniref:Uncharacterized protein n=1 Tax=Rhodopirellula baltica (strain DSM 10527 / NCIMB 13988 / SH1) TaxID=243090 RepID=Q7UKY2_RHOBA|nr:hypothetical protein RB9863 [Rhodopirellula baltica SH 1]
MFHMASQPMLWNKARRAQKDVAGFAKNSEREGCVAGC